MISELSISRTTCIGWNAHAHIDIAFLTTSPYKDRSTSPWCCKVGYGKAMSDDISYKAENCHISLVHLKPSYMH